MISIEGISKLYEIGGPVMFGLRESFENWLRGVQGKDAYQPEKETLYDFNEEQKGERPNTFWALKDISFSVSPGEVVGIIGENGAGKSTLLKILSRITEPTRGRAVLRGRISSLLEVGTGFHPDLTGRENIYLNGAILGMRKWEIAANFDQIVAFAEIEKFIDTPVKYYSSGMYVRLAFAVAAHLNPEILLVDEVLAVGDLLFQQKCLSTIQKLRENGTTLLFVSHNVAAVQSACQRSLWLGHGKILMDGKSEDVITAYTKNVFIRKSKKEDQEASRKYPVSILNFELLDDQGALTAELEFDKPMQVRIFIDAHQRIEFPVINLGIVRHDGVIVCNFNNFYDNFRIDYIEGECSLEGWLPPLRLVPGCYHLHVLVWSWGGGHFNGAYMGVLPFATRNMGEYYAKGPAMNAHDGIFQTPSRKWVFRRKNSVIAEEKISSESIYKAFLS